MRTYSKILCAGLIGLAAAGLACRQRSDGNRLRDLDAGHDKARWLAKTVRTLLYRTEPENLDEFNELLQKSRSEAVDFLTKDPRFGDAVLDFNLFYLGFQGPDMRDTDGNYTYSVKGMPQAVEAARQVLLSGDYMVLFDRFQPMYFFDQVETPDKKGLTNVSDEEARNIRLDRAIESLAQVLAIPNNASTDDFCQKYKEFTDESTGQYDKSGFPTMDNVFNATESEVTIPCFFTVNSLRADVGAIKSAISIRLSWLRSLRQNWKTWTAAIKPAKSLLDLTNVSVLQPPITPRQESFTVNFFASRTNSSTNFSRKRAAYALDTFFCDNLTPLNVALPAAHAGQQGAHATDPACQACHFKLDPMAGFFRSRGIIGMDFSRAPVIMFDDQRVMIGAELERYQKSWHEPIPDLARTRPLRVGYVRSPDMTSELNTWGQTYDDFFKILRQAPEVRQCLTQRMAQYFIGNNLVFDRGWIHELSKKFDGTNGPATSAAFKSIVKDLVLSKSFSSEQPDPDQCYDFPTGQTRSPVPCKVSDIITRNCVTCHNSDDGNGRLNLKNWSATPNGELSFSHFDKNGQRLSKRVTMSRITERLSSADPDFLMPYMMDMPDVERATLYRWASDELKAAK